MIQGERRSVLAGPAGKLEVAFNVPEGDPRGIALIAHPHPLQGGTLDNKVAQTLARTFAALGYAGDAIQLSRRRRKARASSTTASARPTTRSPRWRPPELEFGELPVVLAGFSFGSFVQTRVARVVAAERMVLVGPAVKRFPTETVPPDTIVIHGEEDDVVALADVLAWARPQQLPIIVFPGCGHFFHGRLGELQRVISGMWQK